MVTLALMLPCGAHAGKREAQHFGIGGLGIGGADELDAHLIELGRVEAVAAAGLEAEGLAGIAVAGLG